MPRLYRHTCGLSIRTIRLASELRKHGRRVELFVATNKTDIQDDAIDGMPLHKLPAQDLRPWHWSLQARTKRIAADAAVAGLTADKDLFISCQPEIVSAYRQQHGNAPIIFVCGGSTVLHDAADRSRQASIPILRKAPFILDRVLKRNNERQAFRAADAVVFDSVQTRQRVRRIYKLEPDRCVTIHAGVDADRFRPVTADHKRTARERLGLNPKEVVLVWTGRLSPEKNVQLLIRAIGRRTRSVSRLFIVGDGPEREMLESLCSQERAESVVTFVGSQPDVRPYLHAADIFVFPSISESFGGSLAEAMACGLACIALRSNGDVRNASEEMLDEGCGVIVHGQSPDDLAEAISQLAADRERRRSLGKRASERALKRFTWAAGGQALQALVTRTGRRAYQAAECGTKASKKPTDTLATRSG